MFYQALERVTMLVDGNMKTFEKGKTISKLSPKEISELMDKKLISAVAEKEDLPEMNGGNGFLPVSKIRGMKKKSTLLQYAEEIGVDGVEESMTAEVITNAILDYIANVTDCSNESETSQEDDDTSGGDEIDGDTP